mgnify:CR=1 FL=1
MKKTTFILKFFFSCIVYFSTNISNSQIGIGTTEIANGAILDIFSNNNGVLTPRVSLIDRNDITTIAAFPTTGLLIFNTAFSGLGSVAVEPGFYYWGGTQWVRIRTNNNLWYTEGNESLIAGNHFFGTTINRRIDFRTNNINRLRLHSNAFRLFGLSRGSNDRPFYSFQENTNLGLWSPGVDQLAFSANGSEYIRFTNNDAIFNNTSQTINTRIKSQSNEDLLFIDGTNNRIGIKTETPETIFHISQNNNTVRIDELNFTNNTHYTSSDPMPVYVNTNGDLILRPSLVQNFMALDLVDFIPSTGASGGVIVGRDNGEAVTTNIGSLQTITLTQESVIHVNYQFSVRVSSNTPQDRPYPNDFTVITDGSPRHYSSWVEVNGSSERIAFDSDYYTNMSGSGGGAYAGGFFYLAGKGTIVLPAGTHTFRIRAHTYAGTGKSYRFQFANIQHERFQIIVQR